MNELRRGLAALVAASAILTGAAPSARAESGVTTPEEFLANLVDPTARGKRVSGFLTIAYDLDSGAVAGLDCEIAVMNMSLVATLRHRKQIRSFSRDFHDHTGTRKYPFNFVNPFCRDNDAMQLAFIRSIFSEDVVPHFFACTPDELLPGIDPADPTDDILVPGNCPAFKLKSIRRFETTGMGAFSVELTIVVPALAPEPGDEED